MFGGQEVRNTRERLVSRRLPGPHSRDIDADLLGLVLSGCTLEQIVETSGLRLDEVYQRLLKLRLFIEDATRVSSKH